MPRLRRAGAAPAAASGDVNTVVTAQACATSSVNKINPAGDDSTFQQQTVRKISAYSSNAPLLVPSLVMQPTMTTASPRRIPLLPLGCASAQKLDLTARPITLPVDERPKRPRRTLSPAKFRLGESDELNATSFLDVKGVDASIYENAEGETEPSDTDDDIMSHSKIVSPVRRRLFSPIKPDAMRIFHDSSEEPSLASSSSIDSESDLSDITESAIHGTFTNEMFGPIIMPPTQSDEDISRPVTPPMLSPSKSKLVSPTKTIKRIPTNNVRTSTDGFWSVERVNNWNDQHSPEKVIRSPKKSRMLQFDASLSPSSSPNKISSPSKPLRQALAAKREFDTRREEIAISFLAELDREVTEGQVKALAESTGGVQLIWSKTLNSTAGRANWRRETTKCRKSDGSTTLTHKHFASIELAEKVIDDETRLLNVLAHEFCHLANFMVSGVKDRPHGAEFKSWGRKCTLAFGDRGVQVTTKHSYEIDYKYVWTCTNDDCGVDFKRHSKSIDPERHTCGVCRSKIVQTKPAPRKAAGKTGKAPATGYAAFVKEHFALVKQGLPAGTSHKEVMQALGQRYRAEKEEKASQASSQAQDSADLDDMARQLETIALDG